MMIMSVMKQVKGDQTNLWWGYSSQVNYKEALSTNSKGVIQNFVQLWEQDINKKTNYLNFMCQFSEATTSDVNGFKDTPTSGSNVSTSCGTEDISKITDAKYLTIKGTGTDCPNAQSDAASSKSKYYMS